MKLLALTPIDVPPEEVARRQARYDAIAPDGLQVVVRCPPGLPSELGSEADIAKSDAVLVSAYASEAGAWDGFLPDCVLDPAVHAAASLPRPIHGIGRLAMHALAGAGLSWRAVARNEPIARELDRLAGRYDLATSGRTVVLSLSVADIADEARVRPRPWPPPWPTCPATRSSTAAPRSTSWPSPGGPPSWTRPRLALRVLAGLARAT